MGFGMENLQYLIPDIAENLIKSEADLPKHPIPYALGRELMCNNMLDPFSSNPHHHQIAMAIFLTLFEWKTRN
jgi:hypothetical protein